MQALAPGVYSPRGGQTKSSRLLNGPNGSLTPYVSRRVGEAATLLTPEDEDDFLSQQRSALYPPLCDPSADVADMEKLRAEIADTVPFWSKELIEEGGMAGTMGSKWSSGEGSGYLPADGGGSMIFSGDQARDGFKERERDSTLSLGGLDDLRRGGETST